MKKITSKQLNEFTIKNKEYDIESKISPKISLLRKRPSIIFNSLKTSKSTIFSKYKSE